MDPLVILLKKSCNPFSISGTQVSKHHPYRFAIMLGYLFKVWYGGKGEKDCAFDFIR
jgi:hypothetical protein